MWLNNQCEILWCYPIANPGFRVQGFCRAGGIEFYDISLCAPAMQPRCMFAKDTYHQILRSSSSNQWQTYLSAGGRSALALRLLLAGASSRISLSAGVATGEEVYTFRRIDFYALFWGACSYMMLSFSDYIQKSDSKRVAAMSCT